MKSFRHNSIRQQPEEPKNLIANTQEVRAMINGLKLSKTQSEALMDRLTRVLTNATRAAAHERLSSLRTTNKATAHLGDNCIELGDHRAFAKRTAEGFHITAINNRHS